MRYFFVALMLLAGCSVGPMVTRVTPLDGGKLEVETCTLKYWSFAIWRSGCEVETVDAHKQARR